MGERKKFSEEDEEVYVCSNIRKSQLLICPLRLGRAQTFSNPNARRFYSRMWGEFIGLKSALFGFAPPLFPGGPTWGANMAWKRGMSSAPHHALSLRSELEAQRGREKK